MDIKGLTITIFSFVFLMMGNVIAEEPGSLSYVICKNNAQVRTLRIQKVKSVCRTTYTKEGVDTVVGKFSREEQCKDIFDKIKANLEKADWKCKDISQSRVSFSNE